MTIREAVYQYGKKKYAIQIGDTLLKVCRRLYNTDDDLHLKVLRVLNPRYDWMNMTQGEINYIAEEAVSKVTEV